MYKVMMIDDDMPVLKYLQELIDWRALGFEVCASTFSSVKALQLFEEHKPDLIITDIGIPQINGIQLAERFKKAQPDVGVIFLTCHEDFHYAKQAIALEAEQYLIKDELTAETLEASIRKYVKKMSAIRDIKDSSSTRNTVQRNMIMLKQSFVERITKVKAADTLKEYAKELNMDWKHPHFMVAVASINYTAFAHRYTYKDSNLLEHAVLNIAENICLEHNAYSALIDKDSNLLLVYNFYNKMGGNPIAVFERFLEDLHEKVKQYLSLELSYDLTKTVHELTAMGEWYVKLLRERHNRFYEREMLFRVTDRVSEVHWSLTGADLMHSLEESFLSVYKQGNLTEILAELSRVKSNAVQWRVNPDVLKTTLMRWLRMVWKDNPLQDDFERCALKITTIDPFFELISLAVEAVHETHAVSNPSYAVGHAFSESIANKHPRLQEIERYIMEHLSENISSVTISNVLHLNPSYFSRYFKRLKGENFTDYVHSLKMRIAAKVLLESDETIEYIGHSLGYSDRTYFSKVFKKYNGMSPNEYKHQGASRN
jgi:two-component system response regulator YesN